MLVLSRYTGEKILIGTGEAQITVCVVEIRQGAVRLGIEAPRDVPIVREEIAQQTDDPRTRKENRPDTYGG